MLCILLLVCTGLGLSMDVLFYWVLETKRSPGCHPPSFSFSLYTRLYRRPALGKTEQPIFASAEQSNTRSLEIGNPLCLRYCLLFIIPAIKNALVSFHSTRPPTDGRSGLSRIQGNFCWNPKGRKQTSPLGTKLGWKGKIIGTNQPFRIYWYLLRLQRFQELRSSNIELY